ncbi:unnamed protein product [Brachionus calyciflorus]|uniref:Peptidase S1 domain-containing protein n=1 Tax=Brachionus calyciflorus TaxID=104777 RepID=A0A813X4N2_9BILA|nr:unnamed protein product [Brachionus calyciflorus]
MAVRHSDHEFIPPRHFNIDNKPTTFTQTSLSKPRKFMCLAFALILALVLIAGLIVIILFATIPCKLSKCHSKASTCINHAFRAECICDYGYQGDGYSFCDECGITYNTQNLRIVGGVEAIPHSWPSAALIVFTYKNIAYIASLNVYISINQVYSCGGTLIDRNTVLTAAHCIQSKITFKYNDVPYSTDVKTSQEYPTIESMYKVYLGVHNKTIRTQYPAIEVSVKNVYRHENYDTNSKLNDIGIIKLSKAVDLNSNIQISCLPNPKISFYPENVNLKSYAIGWGTLNYGDTSSSDILRNVDLTIYDGSKCNQVSLYDNDWNKQICAGNYLGGKDTCQGDSGGPLYVTDKVNGLTKYITAGIVSYGDGCAQPELPGIYTRVSYYSKWIQTNKWDLN